MKFWFDTEFIEDGKTIDLLSIGIVSEDGREYYAENRDADLNKASPWVRENVFSNMHWEGMKSKSDIATEIKQFVHGTGKPEFWAYYGAYDWVALCQLYGTMMDLPPGWPMFVRDVKQLCWMLGDPKLPTQGKGEHNALDDAWWTKDAWEFLQSVKP